MIKNTTRLNELARIFQSTDPVLIAELVTSLRDEEPFEGAIALLAELYAKTNDKKLKHTIEEFMNDIRDPDARGEIISEILKDHNDETNSMLVASCWQSGMNYSEHLTVFAGVFLAGSYATAVECMTLIGEAVHECTDEQLRETFNMINNSPSAMTHEKYPLTNELLSMLVRQ